MVGLGQTFRKATKNLLQMITLTKHQTKSLNTNHNLNSWNGRSTPYR